MSGKSPTPVAFIRLAAIVHLILSVAPNARAQRLLGLDVSAWQANISQTTWNNIRNVENRRFVFIRSSRGGTTGFYNQNDPDNSNGNNTFSQRYDDPYFIQNINRATAAGIYAGAYHFSRPDVVESTLNSGGIRNSGANEADHFIQMAGPWMRPGYLVPIHDLEAGDGIRTDNEMAQFSIDFSNRIFQRMGIRPGIYINGNYSANILQTASAGLRDQLAKPAASRPSVIAPAYSVLWVARWPNQANVPAIDVQGTNPKDTFAGFYGPWDDYGDPQPWTFWQYASTGRLPSFNNGANNLDFNAIHGDVEFLEDQLVPAVWMHDSNGDWSTLANWNSGQPPVAPAPGPGQAAPIGAQTLPVARLPGAVGSGVTSGQNDTVILERTNSNLTVTLSTGAHNIRKLYMREALNITGGMLTINYDPAYAANPNFPNALRSGPLSAQFSGPVTLGGSATLNVRALQVDAARNFTLSGGTLVFNKITLLRGVVPAGIFVNGEVTIHALGAETATFASAGSSGLSPSINFAGETNILTIGDSSAEVDVSVDVSLAKGPFTKNGPGTLRLTAANTCSATTISAGTLLVNNSAGSGTGSGAVTVNGGILSGVGAISGPVTINPAGALAPGNLSALGALTLQTPPTLAGRTIVRINPAADSPTSDRLVLTTGALTYGGELIISNIGAPLLGGEVFQIFSAPAYSGTFTSYSLPPLDTGLNWDLSMLPINGTITVNARPHFHAPPTFDGTTLTLQFTGRPGLTYYLQRSTDLIDWLTVSTNTIPSTGAINYTDPNPPNPAAFYKLRSSE